VAIISGIVGQAHARRIKAEQRMAMVQRGMTAEQIDLLLRPAAQPRHRPSRRRRSRLHRRRPHRLRLRASRNS
jgi:hypothetical protein